CRQSWFVDKKRIALTYFEVAGRTHAFRYSRSNFLHFLMGFSSPLLVECTESTFHVHLIGNDICRSVADNLSPGEHGRDPRIRSPADDLLQSCNNLCCNGNRIYILVRMCSMSSSTPDSHIELIGRSHILAGSKSYLSGFNKRHDMLANNSLRHGIFQDTFLDHDGGTSGQFFLSRLENQLDCPTKFRFQFL